MKPPRHVHPSAYMFLIIPFGVASGYPIVALAFLLSKNQVGMGSIATLAAATLLPSAWAFVISPVVDTTFTSRKWYVIGSVFTSVGILVMSLIPLTAGNLPLLGLVSMAANTAVLFVAKATGRLIACATPDQERGRVSGWWNAGSQGGVGLGGGLGLMLSQYLSSPWMGGAILAILCLLCAIPVFFIHEPTRTHFRGLTGNAAFIVKDVWKLARAQVGFVALFLCFLPIGSGAAGNLWSAMANDWKATPGSVAMVTGVMGGIVTAAGALAGGWLCDRMDRKIAYVIFGVFQAASALAMALLPHTEWMFIVWTTAYAFVTGLTYAAFSAFALEAIGIGAAATKYAVLACASNATIILIMKSDGWAYGRFGASGLLYFEAAIGLAGMVLFLAVTAAVRRWWPPHWPHSAQVEFEPEAVPVPIE
jgi:MFS transporter, PAT family, beta-lactamase induction signal transducer AmpG